VFFNLWEPENLQLPPNILAQAKFLLNSPHAQETRRKLLQTHTSPCSKPNLPSSGVQTEVTATANALFHSLNQPEGRQGTQKGLSNPDKFCQLSIGTVPLHL
jgi:hypothetical protein